MGFALKQQGVPKDERRQRVLEAAKLLDLEPYLDRKPRNLSGGQRQRVAMGRAIVRRPQVYLMDEPLSNLDAKLRVQTRTELVELQSRLAVTTVYVTHDQVEAMTMGHRVAVLRDGILQQCDTPSALYHAPANLFVAGFIGSPAMNQLHVSATGPLQIAGADVGIADDLGGERATIGFRPEAVVIGDGPIAARIRVIEDLGSEVFVHLVIQHEGEDQPARRQGRRAVRRRGRRQRADRAARRGAPVRHGRGAAGDRHGVTAVLVTGAAGDIGAAIAARLASTGQRRDPGRPPGCRGAARRGPRSAAGAAAATVAHDDVRRHRRARHRRRHPGARGRSADSSTAPGCRACSRRSTSTRSTMPAGSSTSTCSACWRCSPRSAAA